MEELDKNNTPELDKMTMVCIWLIKTLCIDMEAEKATIEQDITHHGEKIGRYKITITKVLVLPPQDV